MMKRIAFLTLIGLLSWGAPAFGQSPGEGDVDGDGVPDNLDNCSLKANPAQDDTDGDYCGNACDCDYNQNGVFTISDFGQFAVCFGRLNCARVQCVEPISDARIVTIADFGCCLSPLFGGTPGPSGTTPGTTACP